MIDLILKLIEKCIDLVKRREEVTANLYNNFVEPAFKDFEAVHRNYLDSFRHYRDLLSNTQLTLNTSHPIFQELRQDSLFSHDLRAKLWALEPLQEDPILGTLIGAVFQYIMSASTSPLDRSQIELDAKNTVAHRSCENASPPFSRDPFSGMVLGSSNVCRFEYAKSLRGLIDDIFMSGDETRAEALRLLDDLVSRTQGSYENVVRQFTETKLKLLKTI